MLFKVTAALRNTRISGRVRTSRGREAAGGMVVGGFRRGRGGAVSATNVVLSPGGKSGSAIIVI